MLYHPPHTRYGFSLLHVHAVHFTSSPSVMLVLQPMQQFIYSLAQAASQICNDISWFPGAVWWACVTSPHPYCRDDKQGGLCHAGGGLQQCRDAKVRSYIL